MKPRSDEEMVAYALECEPGLLPYIPELLADLYELGSDTELILDILRGLDLTRNARVIDLGCGKGALAVKIAETFHCRVHGIDLFAPFIISSQTLAEKRGVSKLCEFHHGSISACATDTAPADLAILAALGDVLGCPAETVAAIRPYVKPGGYILVSDVFLREGKTGNFPGFEHCACREETIARLTSHGDVLVNEVHEVYFDAMNDDDEDDDSELILARAESLSRQHPELKATLMNFAASQATEEAFIEDNLISAVWVLQKSREDLTQ